MQWEVKLIHMKSNNTPYQIIYKIYFDIFCHMHQQIKNFSKFRLLVHSFFVRQHLSPLFERKVDFPIHIHMHCMTKGSSFSFNWILNVFFIKKKTLPYPKKKEIKKKEDKKKKETKKPQLINWFFPSKPFTGFQKIAVCSSRLAHWCTHGIHRH